MKQHSLILFTIKVHTTVTMLAFIDNESFKYSVLHASSKISNFYREHKFTVISSIIVVVLVVLFVVVVAVVIVVML